MLSILGVEKGSRRVEVVAAVPFFGSLLLFLLLFLFLLFIVRCEDRNIGVFKMVGLCK